MAIIKLHFASDVTLVTNRKVKMSFTDHLAVLGKLNPTFYALVTQIGGDC
jgi:hypothetical protein